MADKPAIRTQPLSRDEIAKITSTPRGIKFIESLAADVSQILPDAIAQALAAVAESQFSADSASAAASAARGIAERVAAAMEAVLHGPPPAGPIADLDRQILGLIPPFPTRADLGLGKVEDISLSTWPGSTNITTLGTVTAGTWQAGVIAPLYGGTGVTSLALLTANPSASVGLTAVNGAASTFMRSDAAPALSQAITPVWTGPHAFSGSAFSDVTTTIRTGSGTTGNFARLQLSENAGAGNLAAITAFGSAYGAGLSGALRVDTGGVERFRVSGGSYAMEINGALSVSSTTLLRTATSLSNGAAVATGTLTNAPAAGNPTKWVPINDAGITRYIPSW